MVATPLRAAIGVCVLILLSGWIIQLVSLSIVQSDLQGRQVSEGETAAGVFPFAGQAAGRTDKNYLSFDWFLFAFFLFVNLLALFVLAKDTRSGSVVKYRIPCSGNLFRFILFADLTARRKVYAAIAAVFATIRINDLTFATGLMSSSAKALLSSYYIQAVPYYLIPFLNGISFLDTVASKPAEVPAAGQLMYPVAQGEGESRVPV
ncbi:hypothetical protein DFJ74DRAFT_682432 [Hyaloraphidium curvatum]|nr:hypothetical protein DFJ74DRAFT_682432 [Hyaloraphidium curvatum]